MDSDCLVGDVEEGVGARVVDHCQWQTRGVGVVDHWQIRLGVLLGPLVGEEEDQWWDFYKACQWAAHPDPRVQPSSEV